MNHRPRKVSRYNKTKRSSKSVTNKVSTANQKKAKKVKEKNDLRFFVQIGVFPEILSASDLSMMSEVNNVRKQASGSFYKYFSEEFNDYSLAASQLQMIKSIGFSDAFIISTLNGEEISIEKALSLD